MNKELLYIGATCTLLLSFLPYGDSLCSAFMVLLWMAIACKKEK